MILNGQTPTNGPRLRARVTGQLHQGRWFQWMLWLLVLLYWLFARYLERIDLEPVLTTWWQAWVPVFGLPQPLVFVVEMLHPRVLRHLVVIYVGWLLAKGAAVGLVQTLYDVPSRESADLFLSRLKSPGSTIGKSVKLSGKTLDADREESVLLRVGGPGEVNVSDEEVATTELNGRFHRVLGPGGTKLGRLEYIYAVLDLRQQERTVENVPLRTKDGIEVTADITVTFRISAGDEPPTRAKPYPYDERAIRLAAYAETILEDGKVSSWEAIPLEIARSQLRRIIAKYRLDEILHPRSAAADPHLTIRNELERLVRVALRKHGIELASLHVGRMELPDQVINQYIEYWQAYWEKEAQLAEADGEAFSLEEIDIARAEAEVAMIRAIVEGLHRVPSERDTDLAREIVALRLIEALERVAEQSQQLQPLPSELLPQLTSLREQLQLEEP